MRESAKNGTCERCLTAAKTAAKTIASYRHGRTGLEYRPTIMPGGRVRQRQLCDSPG